MRGDGSSEIRGVPTAHDVGRDVTEKHECEVPSQQACQELQQFGEESCRHIVRRGLARTLQRMENVLFGRSPDFRNRESPQLRVAPRAHDGRSADQRLEPACADDRLEAIEEPGEHAVARPRDAFHLIGDTRLPSQKVTRETLRRSRLGWKSLHDGRWTSAYGYGCGGIARRRRHTHESS